MMAEKLKIRQYRRWGIMMLFGMIWIVGAVSPGGAVDLHPDLKQKLKDDGRWAATKEVIRLGRTNGLDQPTVLPRLATGAQSHPYGSRIPCILVEFPDNRWTDGTANVTNAEMEEKLFSQGVYPTGSMREYYLENSYGQLDVEGEVVGPIMMDSVFSYYVGSAMGGSSFEPNSRTLAREAMIAADSLLDYTLYDGNGDNAVDGVMIIFAGHGFEESGDSSTIRSHKWDFPFPGDLPVLDGMVIKSYTIQPEEHGPYAGNGPNGIGVLSHEWGHILGVQDLYDEDGTSWGIGNWSMMGSGNYLNNSNTPAHFDPWSKIQLGWLTPQTTMSNLIDTTLPALADSGVVYKLWLAGLSGREYFLVCNRFKTGFDSYLPGSGLLILHVDEYMSDNSKEYIPGVVGHPSLHYRVGVEQADGRYDLEKYEAGNPGDGADLFTDQTIEFDDLTSPGSRAYAGLQTQVAVWNISEPGPVMTANLDVLFSRPLLQMVNYWFKDTLANGNDNGVPDPGETVDFLLTTENLWKSTTDIYLTVSCSDSGVIFDNHTSYISFLDGGGTPYTNYSDPIRFSTPPGMQPTIVDFYLHYEAEGGAFTFADTIRQDLGPKQVLVVDDDDDYKTAGVNLSYHGYYTSTLEDLRVPYAVYDKRIFGSPSLGTLDDYPILIWYTANQRPDSLLLVHDDIVALSSYLDQGGRLFLTGQDISMKLAWSDDSLFLVNYLGARYDSEGGKGGLILAGVQDDPVGEGVPLVIGGSGGASNQNSPDHLLPVAGASASFVYDPAYNFSGKPGGVTFQAGNFKTVFWGFGFEAVTGVFEGLGVSRQEVLSHILFWFTDLATGILAEEETADDQMAAGTVPARFALLQNYPNPFNGETVIEFTIEPGPATNLSIEIINVLGQRVKIVFNGETVPGHHRVSWDGRDEGGKDVASGVYFYRLVTADGFSRAKRLVYLK